MTFKNRFSYKITGKKALQLKIIFDEDNLSIDWSKKGWYCLILYQSCHIKYI